MIGEASATASGSTGGNAAMALGGTDSDGVAVDWDASGAQCLLQTIWSAAECIMCGQLAAMDVPPAAIDAMLPEGAMHA